MVERRGGLDGHLPESGRLGRGVGVKGRLPHGRAARPEAVADHLVRVRLTHEGRPVAWWRDSAREPRDRQIETAPEKVRRTALPDETASTGREDVLGGRQDAPEA